MPSLYARDRRARPRSHRVLLDHDAVRQRPRRNEREREWLRSLRVDADPAAEHQREHLEVELIDEAGVQQRVDDRATTRDEDRPAALLLERLDRAREIVANDRRVLPVR